MRKKEDWEEKKGHFKEDRVPAMVTMWEEVVSKCLNDEFQSADEVITALKTIDTQ